MSRPRTRAEIRTMMLRFTAHCDRMLDSGHMSYDAYKLAIDDLRLWALLQVAPLEPGKKHDGRSSDEDW